MESKAQLLDLIETLGSDRRKYLKEFFKYLPEAAAKEMIYEEVAQKEYILRSGDPVNTVFIILQGEVIGLDYQQMGQVYSFMDFTRMYILGDFELYSHASEYGVSICAEKNCRLLKISAKSYLNWIRHDENALFLRLNHILSILTFERKIDREYIHMDCKERVKYFLIRFYEKEHIKNRKVRFENTQAELAEKVGFNKRSVQRSIAALDKDNLISIENGKITISYEQYLNLKTQKGGKQQDGKI